MRKLRVMVLAVLALALIGATTKVLEILERDHWIKVRVQPPGNNGPVELYTSKDAITE